MQKHLDLVGNVMEWPHVVTNKGLEDKNLVNFIYLNVWERFIYCKIWKKGIVADWSSLCGDQAKQLNKLVWIGYEESSKLKLAFILDKSGAE